MSRVPCPKPKAMPPSATYLCGSEEPLAKAGCVLWYLFFPFVLVYHSIRIYMGKQTSTRRAQRQPYSYIAECCPVTPLTCVTCSPARSPVPHLVRARRVRQVLAHSGREGPLLLQLQVHAQGLRLRLLPVRGCGVPRDRRRMGEVRRPVEVAGGRKRKGMEGQGELGD